MQPIAGVPGAVHPEAVAVGLSKSMDSVTPAGRLVVAPNVLRSPNSKFEVVTLATAISMV